jgi:hypothetical protein
MAAHLRRCLFAKYGLPRLPRSWDPRWNSVSVALVLFVVTVSVLGQDGKVPIEPGSPSVLYYVDDSARLIPLEPQVVHVKRKLHALGFTGTTAVYQVPGEKSTVRLKADRKAEFVIRMKDKVDPLESVQFYRFEGMDGSRVVPIEDIDALGRVTSFPLASATVDFNAVKYGASSFKLIPIQKLAPGEYCLTVRLATKQERNSSGFCFGIDTLGS